MRQRLVDNSQSFTTESFPDDNMYWKNTQNHNTQTPAFSKVALNTQLVYELFVKKNKFCEPWAFIAFWISLNTKIEFATLDTLDIQTELLQLIHSTQFVH